MLKRPNEWKDNMENRSMRLNMNKNQGYDKWGMAEGNAKGCKVVMWCLW